VSLTPSQPFPSFYKVSAVDTLIVNMTE